MSRCSRAHVAVEVALDGAHLRVELGVQLVAELGEHVVDAAEDHDGEEDQHHRDAGEDAARRAPGRGVVSTPRPGYCAPPDLRPRGRARGGGA